MLLGNWESCFTTRIRFIFCVHSVFVNTSMMGWLMDSTCERELALIFQAHIFSRHFYMRGCATLEPIFRFNLQPKNIFQHVGYIHTMNWIAIAKEFKLAGNLFYRFKCSLFRAFLFLGVLEVFYLCHMELGRNETFAILTLFTQVPFSLSICTCSRCAV